MQAQDVYYARVADAQALQDVRRELQPVLAELRAGELPIDWHPYLNSLREQLDDALIAVAQANGDADLATVITEARVHVMSTWRAAVGNDSEGSRALEHAEELQVAQLTGSCSWVYQATSPAWPIPDDVLAISLLSESMDDIRRAVARLEESGAMKGLRKVALAAVLEALAVGQVVPDHREKLAAMGVAL